MGETAVLPGLSDGRIGDRLHLGVLIEAERCVHDDKRVLDGGEKVAVGWTNVLRSDSSAVEKLDALSWVNTNARDRFGDEFRIQLARMRQSPTDTPNPGWLFAKRVRQMKTLLAEAIRSNEISIDSPSNEMLARCVVGVGWIPENILRQIGTRASQLHVSDTTLRGVTSKAVELP